MLYLSENGNIRLTRGDTARFAVLIINDLNGREYEMSEDDTLTLTVKKNLTDKAPIFQKKVV